MRCADTRRNLGRREKAERERMALLARQQAEEVERLAEETRRSQVLLRIAVSCWSDVSAALCGAPHSGPDWSMASTSHI